MLLNKEKVIKFLGYLYVNYERNINYIWYVIVSDDIEEIFIEIKIDIYWNWGFLCDDYLQVCVF